MFKLRYLLGAMGGVGALVVGTFAVLRARRAISHLSPIAATVTIKRTPQEVFDQLRGGAHFADYLPHAAKLEWKARIVDEVPGNFLAFEATPGEPLRVDGRISLTQAPNRTSTEVRIELKVIGNRTLGRIVGGPVLKGGLRRLKQVMETGEILRSDASLHVRPHPAQPSLEAAPAPDFYVPHLPNVDKGAVS